MTRLRFGDLVLASNAPLPTLPPDLPAAADDPPECEFRLLAPSGPAHSDERWDHHRRHPEGVVSFSCGRDGQDYRLGFPGLATFLIECGGRAITCRPHEQLPVWTVEHLLIDQVLPRVLTHRGRLVIHAACVATPRGAIAFLGDSGAGKSTLCAEFARSGFPLVGDDGIVVRPAVPSGFEAIATYPGLRLLPDPLARLFEKSVGAAPVAHYTAKRRLDRDRAELTLAADPQPLLALYLLDEGPKLDVAEISERDAFMALLRASFQLHLDDQERSRGHFERIGALQDAIPVRRLTYPRDYSVLGEVREALTACHSRIDASRPESR